MSDFWKNGLVDRLKNKSNILLKTNELAVIIDAYPKSRFHYLILPFDENLNTIYDLTPDLIEILDEFELLGINMIELLGSKIENFKMGFHAAPSMNRLHLHVISKDFDSPSLKHKKHWNSFNTDFLVPIERVRSDLSKYGEVQKFSEEEIKSLLNTPLRCNTCSYKPKHMPDLKKHLLSHVSDYCPF